MSIQSSAVVILGAIVAAFLFLNPTESHGTEHNRVGGEQCGAYSTQEEAAVQLCSRANGGSGHYFLKNLSIERVRICVRFHFNPGGKRDVGDKECKTLGPGEEARVICFSCGRNNRGIRRWELVRFTPL